MVGDRKKWVKAWVEQGVPLARVLRGYSTRTYVLRRGIIMGQRRVSYERVYIYNTTSTTTGVTGIAMNESTLSYKGEEIPYLLAPALAGERKRKFKELVSRMGLMAEGVNCRGV